eukprot:COSAG01_NODE_29137_length_644_cov_1.875229_1_plen_84_part_10
MNTRVPRHTVPRCRGSRPGQPRSPLSLRATASATATAVGVCMTVRAVLAAAPCGGNSGALLRVCRVRRSVSPLRELWDALAGIS